jgi:hypothetical protein
MASTGQPKKAKIGQKEHDSQDNSLLTRPLDRTLRTGHPEQDRSPYGTGHPGYDIQDRRAGQDTLDRIS